MKENRVFLENNRSRAVGFLAGIIFAGVLVYAYQWYSTPQDMRQLYRIKGYEKLNEDQVADIRMLSGIYETGYMDNWLSGAESKGMGEDDPGRQSIEKSKIKFTDPRNAEFAENDYQAVEIFLYDRTRYQKLADSPEMVKNIFGVKDAIEIRYERKGLKEDFFLLVISASGDMYFIPSQKIGTEERIDKYWTVYPLRKYSKRYNY